MYAAAIVITALIQAQSGDALPAAPSLSDPPSDAPVEAPRSASTSTPAAQSARACSPDEERRVVITRFKALRR